MPDIVGLNGGLVRSTPDLTDLLPVQDSQGITHPATLAGVVALTLASANFTARVNQLIGSGGTGLSPWATKTANYTAIAGDRLRVNATAGDVVITLPTSPTAVDSDIWLQRLDTSANKVLIRSGSNKLNAQTGKDGVFAPTVIQAIERLSYVDATIGWLGQYDRLTYQNAPVVGGSDSLFANVVLLMPMTTTSGITDIKGKIATNQGVTQSTAILDPFGQNAGVVSFTGLGNRISIAQSTDFAFGGSAFAIEWWLYPTAIPSGVNWGLFDARPSPALSDWWFAGKSDNAIGMADPSYPSPYAQFTSAGLQLNTWQYICVSRDTTGFPKTWINGSLLNTATVRNNAIAANGNLLIGDLVDTGAPYNDGFIGYGSNLRITRAYRDGSIVPTAAFPSS